MPEINARANSAKESTAQNSQSIYATLHKQSHENAARHSECYCHADEVIAKQPESQSTEEDIISIDLSTDAGSEQGDNKDNKPHTENTRSNNISYRDTVRNFCESILHSLGYQIRVLRLNEPQTHSENGVNNTAQPTSQTYAHARLNGNLYHYLCCSNCCSVVILRVSANANNNTVSSVDNTNRKCELKDKGNTDEY